MTEKLKPWDEAWVVKENIVFDKESKEEIAAVVTVTLDDWDRVHFIASAPDLYRALVGLLEHEDSPYDSWRGDAIAAIRKARGYDHWRP